MDRGGTITWYLTANDADFNSTVRRVRGEARRTATDVDRDFKKGFGNARLSLDDFHRDMSKSASHFRNFQIALRGFEMTALILGATMAGGALIQLAGALTSLLGLLYTAPAAIGAFGGALATLRIATGGIGKAFQSLTKSTGATAAASGLARKQSDLMRNAMRQDEALTRRLTGLKEDYNNVLKELAEVRLEALNEQILKGVDAWSRIADAADSYLDISKSLADLTDEVTAAQDALNTAMITYGPASQQALTATRDLFAAQGKLAGANSDLDTQYGTIKDSVKDLATNIESLRKANRNEMASSALNLKALRADKLARGENVAEITDMIKVLDELIGIKDTKLSLNPDLAGAQRELDSLKQTFPDIAIAAASAASDSELSLNKSLTSISEAMDDVRRDSQQLQEDLTRNMAEALEDAMKPAGGGGEDPFAGLSRNARSFVFALKDVYDAFQPIKMSIQDKFFAGLDTEVRNLANSSFPLLEIGLGYIATAMNGMAKEASRVMQEPFFKDAMMYSMSNTAEATSILTRAVEPLLKAFTDLMNIGNPFILRLSEWVVKQSELAAAFTGSAEGQTRINKAIENGITAMKQIADLVGSVVGLFSDLFAISSESGSILTTLTTIVDNMRKWLAESENQKKMQALFEATSTVMLAMADALGKIFEVILNVVEAYNNLDGPAKDFITDVIVLSALLTPLLTYFSALVASGSLIFHAFREIGQATGLAIKGFGVVRQGLTDLKSGFDDSRAAASTFTGFMGTVGGKLATAKTAMVDGAKAAADWGKKMVVTAAQATVSAAKMVGSALLAAGAWVAGAVATAAAWVIANAAMLGIWGLIIAAVIGAVALIIANWDSISAFFVGVWEGIKNVFAVVGEWFAGVFSAAWEGIKAIWDFVIAYYTGIWNGIVLIFSVVGEWFAGVFRGAWEGIKNIWNAVGGFFQGVWNGITRILGNVGGWIRDRFQEGWNGLTQIWNNIGNFFGGVWNNITNAFANVWNLGGDIVRGLWNGISNMTSWVVSKIQGFGQSVLGGIKSFFGIKSPSRIMRDQVGKMLGYGIADGITDSTGEAVTAAKSAAEQITDAFAMNTLATNFSVGAESSLASQFAPSMLDNASGSGLGGGQGVVINQTNEIYSDVDMDQVNRNLTWEMSKV